MGSTYWEAVEVGVTADEALRRLQARVFDEAGYDLATLLARRVADMERAVAWCAEDDPYDQLAFYRDALDRFRRMAAVGVPGGSEARIALLRRIVEVSGDRVGNVLDVTGVGEGDDHVRPLSPNEVAGALGAEIPTLEEARRGRDRLAGLIPRGSAVCFPIRGGGWFFAGHSAD